MSPARAAPSTVALLLSGCSDDLASLRALCDVVPDAAARPWRSLTSAARATVALSGPCLDRAAASALLARGARVATVRRIGDDALLRPLGGRATERWSAVRERAASSLPEALPPRRVRRDEPAREALLLTPADSPAALRILERLLALGRADASAHAVAQRGVTWLVLRVPQPPMYLLLRARDEPGEEVAAYVRQGDGALWVAFGYEHPQPALASMLLQHKGLCALVDADGAWRTLPAALPTTPLHALLAGRVEASSAELVAVPPPRFTLTLRLEADATPPAEAWLLDAHAMLDLEGLVDALSDDDRRRCVVCRLQGERAAVYFLRERRRSDGALAERICEALGDPGFVGVPGVAGLYVRSGYRLAPSLRPEQLRDALGHDPAQCTLVDLDAAGLRIVHVRADAEWTLADWVDLVSTDRRTTLDQLAEGSVFDWPSPPLVAPPPDPSAIAPPAAVTEADLAAAATPATAPPDATRPVSSEAGLADATETAARDVGDPTLRAQERALVRGARDDHAAWSSLAARELAAGDDEAAAACLEAAIFFGATGAEAADALVHARSQRVAPEAISRALSDPSPDAATLVLAGALALQRLAAGPASIDDATLLSLTRRFEAPDAPASRWLAWSVLRAAHAARRDPVALTRARERLLGAVNTLGLREAIDAPRFYRAAVLDRDDPSSAGEAHLRALDALWEHIVREGGAVEMFARAIASVGYERLGAGLRASSVAGPLRAALDATPPVNRALLRLYLALPTAGDDPVRWAQAVTAAHDSLRGDARARDRVEHLRTRSEWLRSPAAVVPPSRVRPALTRVLDELQADPSRAPARLRAVFDAPGLYDHEVALAVERCLDLTLGAGDEAALQGALRVAASQLDARVSSPASRSRALGACVRAAAALNDLAGVNALLQRVAMAIDAPQAAHVSDLLDAVRPSLRALHRFGAAAAGERFFEALDRAADRGGAGALRLRVAAADGMLSLQRTAAAHAALDRCVEAVVAPGLDPVERYQSARDLLGTLRRLPLAQRSPRCERIARALGMFTDTFSASQAGLYETHKVLLLERLVDALSDEITPGGDALQALLDEDELALRRRIYADWSDACGP